MLKSFHTLQLDGTTIFEFSVNTLESVLKNTTNDEFNKKYGRNKPDLDQQIVFSCKMGGRAAKAFGIATNLGFKK